MQVGNVKEGAPTFFANDLGGVASVGNRGSFGDLYIPLHTATLNVILIP